MFIRSYYIAVIIFIIRLVRTQILLVSLLVRSVTGS